MRKKAQGISLNVIIIAALGLLVLVVLAIIFTGRTGVFVRESDKCELQGGRCVESREDCTGLYERVGWGACDLNSDNRFHYNNEDEDGFCCISVGDTGED